MLPLVIMLISGLCLSIFLASASPVFAGRLTSYKKLCKALKDLPGWHAKKCEGMKISGSPMGEIVSAHRVYTQENKRVEAMVIGSMQAMGYWAPFASHMQMESDEEFVKVTNIDGHDVGIGYHKQDKTGGIVVKLTGREEIFAVFVLNFNGMDWQEALKIVKQFDWDKMAKLLK